MTKRAPTFGESVFSILSMVVIIAVGYAGFGVRASCVIRPLHRQIARNSESSFQGQLWVIHLFSRSSVALISIFCPAMVQPAFQPVFRADVQAVLGFMIHGA